MKHSSLAQPPAPSTAFGVHGAFIAGAFGWMLEAMNAPESIQHRDAGRSMLAGFILLVSPNL